MPPQLVLVGSHDVAAVPAQLLGLVGLDHRQPACYLLDPNALATILARALIRLIGAHWNFALAWL